MRSWKGWRKEWERSNSLEAEALQRQVLGINDEVEIFANKQRQMGISTENNTQRIEELVEQLVLLQSRIDKLEAEKEINNEGNDSVVRPTFSGSFGEAIMVDNKEATCNSHLDKQ